MREMIRKHNFFYKYVPSRLNLGADDLAKQGRDIISLIEGWFV